MKRQIEVFVAGCALCEDAVTLVRETACDDCEVTVHDMREPDAQEKALGYGVASVPTVVVDGRLADCCSRGPVNADSLKTAGVGQPL